VPKNQRKNSGDTAVVSLLPCTTQEAIALQDKLFLKSVLYDLLVRKKHDTSNLF
jgi:hypothetical protein